MAFAMRDEWKEEPVSITGAEYVEPSATELIRPGQVASLVNEYVPRPPEVPDLSLTDYLADLDAQSRSRLLAELNNHFGLYLYGRQIVAGGKPSRGAGNPFMSGAIGDWAAERNKAVDEAVPKIIERLRPKYGRMYNFDDAQPGNVRLMAMAIQPSLTNR
jgi:hypothetical protein